MTWSDERSRKRIKAHLQTVPEFDPHITLAAHGRLLVEARKRNLMDQLPVRRAFLVEGAHLYGRLLDFDDVAAEPGRGETAASHERMLRFLNLHYQIWDAIVDDDDSDRVDYHGSRLHAVVTAPPDDPRSQIVRAIALAERLTRAAERVASAHGYPARVRFGIDHGRCIAMSTGRAHEKDTLFLGSPANHAAKLAAQPDEQGIFLTEHAKQIVGSSEVEKTWQGDFRPSRFFVQEAVARFPFPRLDAAVARLIEERPQDVNFVFHRATPPLSSLKFADLSPSNSVRMGIASLFADIDGFTAFVDKAITRGNATIKQAATGIHVIREELNDVLKDDFGGKRIRFIGDCIHGALAEGKAQDDPQAAVRESALCAAGMRSSFSLVQELVGGLDELDLAVGIEYGPVPVTRIGKRGEESVRCAAGRAVVVSEAMQQSIVGGGVKLGPVADQVADGRVRKYFGSASHILNYDEAADLLGSLASPAVSIIRSDTSARSHMKL